MEQTETATESTSAEQMNPAEIAAAQDDKARDDEAPDTGAQDDGAQEAASDGSAAHSNGADGEAKAPNLQSLIEHGVHFGHQTRRWNPKMSPYIYGSRNGIHIIDLDQTVQLFERAYQFLASITSRGGTAMFVGTKRQAAETVAEEAGRANQFYVTGRWLGGTLTNFRTMKSGIERLRHLERMSEDGTMETLLKKEALQLERERERLERYLGGIKKMTGLPDAMVIVDPQHEHIAVREGVKLRIPIIAVTDTNCDPDPIDYIVPANDDAIRSIKLIVSSLADACLHGQARRKQGLHHGSDAAATAGGGVQVEFARGRKGAEAETPA